MFCPQCGNELLEKQAFCPNCGANLSEYIKLYKTAKFGHFRNRNLLKSPPCTLHWPCFLFFSQINSKGMNEVWISFRAPNLARFGHILHLPFTLFFRYCASASGLVPVSLATVGRACAQTVPGQKLSIRSASARFRISQASFTALSKSA